MTAVCGDLRGGSIGPAQPRDPTHVYRAWLASLAGADSDF